jgi:hypothetical protein
MHIGCSRQEREMNVSVRGKVERIAFGDQGNQVDGYVVQIIKKQP